MAGKGVSENHNKNRRNNTGPQHITKRIITQISGSI